MLSYLHSFHAGNFADVHKHAALCQVLKRLTLKAKPFSYIDTHAGAGLYGLEEEEAQKTGEYRDGIARLWSYQGDDPVIGDYLRMVRAVNAGEALSFYPGSPTIAGQYGREEDVLILNELHPREHKALRRAFKHDGRSHIHKRDAFEALPALCPPEVKRGMVIIDPAYEMKDDYTKAAEALTKAYKRWSSGIFMLWYPMLPMRRHEGMVKKLKESGIPNMLHSELFGTRQAEERGMFGSGLVIINPPFEFDTSFAPAGQIMAKAVFPSRRGHYQQNWLTAVK